MLYRIFEFAHSIGIHFWDIPSILVLVLMAVVAIVHTKRQRKREKDFEEELKKQGETKMGEVGHGLYH